MVMLKIHIILLLLESLSFLLSAVLAWDIVYDSNAGISYQRQGEIRNHYTRCTRRYTPGTCSGPIQMMWTFVFSLQNCTERLGCPREPRSNRFRTYLRCIRHCQSLIDLYTHILASDNNSSLYLRNDTQRNDTRRSNEEILYTNIESYEETHELEDLGENNVQNTAYFWKDLSNRDEYSPNEEYDNYENIDINDIERLDV